MSKSTSMTLVLASYFWIAIIVLVVKIVTGIKGVIVEVAFVLISMTVMLLVFSSIMKERCGTAPFGAVLGAVLPPWIIMVGGVVALIRIFPGWIQPFSNTFGYLFCLIPAINTREKLTAILDPKNTTLSKLIIEDTSLMLNEFSSSRYNEIIDNMVEGGIVTRNNSNAIEEFGKVVNMKDSIAEFLWYLLIGCVAITTAYNNMMNVTCQKAGIIEVPVKIDTNLDINALTNSAISSIKTPTAPA